MARQEQMDFLALQGSQVPEDLMVSLECGEQLVTEEMTEGSEHQVRLFQIHPYDSIYMFLHK